MELQTKIKKEDKQDIDELVSKINRFGKGEIDEERFKLYRLTRGVYGQRQHGVHMFRTKLPYGRVTAEQLRALANISDKYATGNLHITTRQNIQFHYVKLIDSPALWTDLATAGLTAREACGNTVRNITASAAAGVDPEELFDITPYVQEVFEYFLRNPICQDMGRKIKPAFSSSDQDSAFTYFHDFGFVPRIENGKRGFKLVIGGGLGSVPVAAELASEFIAADLIVPFMEAALRVFDRYGEREKRNKARMKFLMKKIGVEGLLSLIHEEIKALPYEYYPIEGSEEEPVFRNNKIVAAEIPKESLARYEQFVRANTFVQRQSDYVAVQLRVLLGDIKSKESRELADIVDQFAADDIRFTVNQGILLRYVQPDNLPALFLALDKLNLANPGFDSIADITACPGTDTCNLGVTNSTGLAEELELILERKYPELMEENHLKIKISGCMNACGQHMASPIGLHGSSIKKDNKVIPAMQIVLGGGLDFDGKGFMAERIIKLPTKRIPDAIATIVDDYLENSIENEHYNYYFQRQGKRYFYDILKYLGDISTLDGTDLFDWGQDHLYMQAIGVGECAAVVLDLVGTIFNDSKERLDKAKEELDLGNFAASIYYSYSSQVIAAKALLLNEDVKCNTHIKIINDFKEHLIDTKKFEYGSDFVPDVLQINTVIASLDFAKEYYSQAESFLKKALDYKASQSTDADKIVVDRYYKA